MITCSVFYTGIMKVRPKDDSLPWVTTTGYFWPNSELEGVLMVFDIPYGRLQNGEYKFKMEVTDCSGWTVESRLYYFNVLHE